MTKKNDNYVIKVGRDSRTGRFMDPDKADKKDWAEVERIKIPRQK